MPTPRFRKLAAARLATSEIISPAVSALFDGEGGASALATRQVPVARLTPMPGQPHRPFNPADLSTLAQSIAEHGVLEPILVRPIGSGGYQIIAGERRWRAAILSGLERIPAVIREMDDLTALQTALGEDLQRRAHEIGAPSAAAAPVEPVAMLAHATANATVPLLTLPVAQQIAAEPAPVIVAAVVETPIVLAPSVATPIVAAPIVAAPVAAAPVAVAPVVAEPVVAASVTETSDALTLEREDDLLDRIGAIWARARDLAGLVESERGDLSSYDRERARKALLSIRIAADNSATLLRD
jgi:hypothetical protein